MYVIQYDRFSLLKMVVLSTSVLPMSSSSIAGSFVFYLTAQPDVPFSFADSGLSIEHRLAFPEEFS